MIITESLPADTRANPGFDKAKASAWDTLIGDHDRRSWLMLGKQCYPTPLPANY